jgi:hypothetical protein
MYRISKLKESPRPNKRTVERNKEEVSLSSPKVAIYFSDDGRTTETCSYLYISNISSYDINVA